MKKILATKWIPEEVLRFVPEEFQVVCPSKEKGAYTYDEVKEILPEYNGLLTIGCKADQALLDAGKKLEAVGSFGVGYDNIDYQYAGKKGIYTVNAPRAVMMPTAELTIGLILSIARCIVKLDKELREKKKTGLPAFSNAAVTVYGKTLGIIGMGRIGKEVARRAKALGMDIIYADVYRADKAVEEELNAVYVSKEELLKTADFVTLHCPLTLENRHLIDDKAFELMKESAYLINASRGPVVEEKALAKALKSNRIKGAALDVFENEPEVLPELFDLDNIVIVPHIGTYTWDARAAIAAEAISAMIEVMQGKLPSNIVNKEFYEKK